MRGDEKRLSVGGQALDGLGQRWRDGNTEEGFGLLLMDFDEPVFNVFPPHANNIRAALSGIERQQHRKASHAARLMALQKLGAPHPSKHDNRRW